MLTKAATVWTTTGKASFYSTALQPSLYTVGEVSFLFIFISFFNLSLLLSVVFPYPPHLQTIVLRILGNHFCPFDYKQCTLYVPWGLQTMNWIISIGIQCKSPILLVIRNNYITHYSSNLWYEIDVFNYRYNTYIEHRIYLQNSYNFLIFTLKIFIGML